jgi:hypothetical protein
MCLALILATKHHLYEDILIYSVSCTNFRPLDLEYLRSTQKVLKLEKRSEHSLKWQHQQRVDIPSLLKLTFHGFIQISNWEPALPFLTQSGRITISPTFPGGLTGLTLFSLPLDA